VQYDAAGRQVDTKLMIVQWQDGRIVATDPPQMAVAKPIWPKDDDAGPLGLVKCAGHRA
jgi:branched-chain amino acid transport system substrate-binding protein